MEESNDLSNHQSTEHIFCGFSRRSSQLTNFENYYYGMDESSDQTYSEDDDEYDETNTDDGDCESTFYYAPKGQTSGRLSRRHVTMRLEKGSKIDNTFRNRSKWKKYDYQAVSMRIEEEDEEMAGPSNEPNPNQQTNLIMNNEINEHVIIHVNELEFNDDDELSIEDEIYPDRKSLSENDSLLVAYDRNLVSSV